jgi:hypothetical protein
MTDLDRLLDFAERSRLAEGGFGYLGDDGHVLPDRPVETWIVARMTHVFGLAHLLGRPGAGELSAHGVAALTDGPLHDGEHGGWRASTGDDTKAAYVHAFAVLAGSTAATAGIAGGPALLDEALDVWQTRFWDEDARQAWRDGFEQNCRAPCYLDPRDVDRFLAAVPSMRKGDATTLLFTSNGVQVTVNGRSMGDIGNPHFAKTMLATFIGPEPPTPRLKRELLGGRD